MRVCVQLVLSMHRVTAHHTSGSATNIDHKIWTYQVPPINIKNMLRPRNITTFDLTKKILLIIDVIIHI
jgi:hypothetical protein